MIVTAQGRGFSAGGRVDSLEVGGQKRTFKGWDEERKREMWGVQKEERWRRHE